LAEWPPPGRFKTASVVWDILAQELQARNRRDCTVAALPGELASLIFDFITLRDVTRCTFVCKDWFRLTVSTPHVWKKLIVRVRDQVRASDLQSTFLSLTLYSQQIDPPS